MNSFHLQYILGLAACFLGSALAGPAPASKIPPFWQEITPTPQGEVKGEAKVEFKCYALPYGGIGFASHILTYYTLIAIGYGRNPLWPWKHLKHWKWNLGMSLLGMAVGTAFAIVSIVRCRDRWEFLILAISKTLLTIALGGFCAHAFIITRRLATKPPTEARTETEVISFESPSPVNSSMSPDLLSPSSPYQSSRLSPVSSPSFRLSSPGDPTPRKPAATDWTSIRYWLILYIPGVLTGVIGILALVAGSWSDHKKLPSNSAHALSTRIRYTTYIFVGIMAVILICTSIWSRIHYGKRQKEGSMERIEKALAPMNRIWWRVAGGMAGMEFMAALYGDWVLAAFMGNWSGVPSADNAVFYWGYLIAKKVSMLSI